MNRIIGFVLAAAIAAGCSASPSGDSQAGYLRALDATASAPTVAPRSAAEAKAIQDFIDFYKVFSRQSVAGKVRQVYARSAWFRDPFHEVAGIDAIEKYFLASTESIEDCRFDMQDVARSDRNYYFRWIMPLKTKRDPANPIEAIGMTHVRFDADGRVVFHQDYWDAGSAVYERVPVLGSLVRFVKSRVRGD